MGLKKADIGEILRDFVDFCSIDLQLRPNTVKSHRYWIGLFLRSIGDIHSFNRSDVRSYLARYRDGNPNTYANVLKSLKVFVRDYLGAPEIVKSFKFPRRYVTIKFIPNKEDLHAFYDTLPRLEGRLYFLLYASTGLRRTELMDLGPDDVDFEKRMLIPNKQSRTKRTWVTFYNDEAEELLLEYLPRRPNHKRIRRLIPIRGTDFQSWWRDGYKATGLKITPQVLRLWFCVEMARLGVPDRYVDAFCGRMPKTILARHYSDYSPQTLKEFYDKANLKVLS